MRENNSGQYVETLGNQPSFQVSNSSGDLGQNGNKQYKIGDTRPPTLVEVMLDTEFLQEFRFGNKVLFNYMDQEKMLQMADYVILEPKFSDSPERCFQLPFLACEVLTCDVWPVAATLFNEWADHADAKQAAAAAAAAA